MPPARVRVPGSAPMVLHSTGDVSRLATVLMRKSVVPYISMRSPTPCAPTLRASDQASIVPVITGMPAGSPVASAASAVTVPAASPGHRSAGSSRSGAMCRHHGSCQACASVSYMGEHWLAEWWSRTYAPVSRWASQELGMKNRRTRANVSGSVSAIHSSLGPAAWVESAEPPRSRIFRAPSSFSRRAIWAVARESTP